MEKILAVISNHDRAYTVQWQIPKVLEGDWKPDRLVVIEFPSRGSAKVFLADPQAQAQFASKQDRGPSRKGDET